jgi:GH43 family beta-xylosidase
MPAAHWHICFCPTHKPTLRKTKRAIFCHRTFRLNDNNSNTFYPEKQDRRKIKSIFADSFQRDMNRIKEVLDEKGVKQTWLAEATWKKLQYGQLLCAKPTTAKT